mgnify:CR=1 FL=1
MKHFALFLCLLWLVPVCGLCETILWEDEAGQVILGDDGNVQFISPDGEAADENVFVPTAVPAESSRLASPSRGRLNTAIPASGSRSSKPACPNWAFTPRRSPAAIIK